MATSQTTARKARGNGRDQKAIAARAAKDELQTAQEAAETFVSAVKSSASHFSEHLGRAAQEKVSLATDEAQNVRAKLEDQVRERPLMAIGIAAGAGVALAMLTRR